MAKESFLDKLRNKSTDVTDEEGKLRKELLEFHNVLKDSMAHEVAIKRKELSSARQLLTQNKTKTSVNRKKRSGFV